MITSEIDLINLDAVKREIDQLSQMLSDDELGRVYHEGAYGRNGQRYEALVQKAGEQAAVHQGWWQTDQDVIEKREGEIRARFESLVHSIAAGRRVSVRQAAEESLRTLYEDLRRYPASRGYPRTGQLAAGWRWAVT